jgi:Flp pilus assembly protein TadD
MQEDIEALIAQGLELETDDSADQAIAYFADLVQRYPDNARVQFETGGAYDFAGHESTAIPHYRRAIELGLSDEDMLRVTVQLASSLRNVGEISEAVALLAEGCAKYPQHRALRAFYALALHSFGQSAKALAELLTMTLDAPDFYERYNRSLRYYAEELIRE